MCRVCARVFKMSSLEGDNRNLGLFARETSSDVSIGDRIELQHGFYNYDQAKAASNLVSPDRPSDSVATAFEPNLIRPSTSYILMRSDNLETNVDCWIESCDNERNRRRENVPGVQRPILAEAQGVLTSLWYMLALLPTISVHRRGWCSPSNSFTAVINWVEILSTYLKQIILNARMKLSRLAIDQILQECFVVAIEVGLAFHAIIFLVLAVYQDSI